MGLNDNYFDMIIIGAGPAGLTAGIYAARSGLKALILEEKFPGGIMSDAPLVENYPGLEKGITGLELANRMEMQAKKFGAQINNLEKAIELKLDGETKVVISEKNTYRAKAIILSLGTSYRRLSVPGEKKFHGKGVSYCGTCDGPFFKGKKVVVIGGGNSTAITAIHLSALASNVKLTYRGDSFRAEDALVKQLQHNGVEIILNTRIKEIRGSTMVQDIVLEDVKTGQKRVEEVDGVFVQIGKDPPSLLAKNAGVRTDERGYFIVDSRQRTNIEGVYAAGDVTNYPIKQIGTAVGQAIIAAIDAFAYIKKHSIIPDENIGIKRDT